METIGRVLHNAAFYDALAWLWSGGKERAFRDKLVTLASLKTGDSVLDVGCGSGTLTIAAKKRVGKTGPVFGIDASREMITRARMKAKRARAEIAFQNAIAEQLPFPNEYFDVVLSSLMLHHLPKTARTACLKEIRRVLKPGGRVLIADFETSGDRRGLMGLLHRRRHGHVGQEKLASLLSELDLRVLESGRVGLDDVHFTIAGVSLE